MSVPLSAALTTLKTVLESRLMFTHAHLAELADVKPARLRYWESTGLVEASASEESVRGRHVVRLYDFKAALTVLALAALRHEHVTLQHLRQIVAHLRQRDFDVPEVKFALAGPRVFFQTPDGEWEDVRDPAQIVLHQTLDLRLLRARLARALERSELAHGQTERRRGALGSKPVVAGTRVPVDAVRRYLERGYSSDQIITAYPSLTEADIDAIRTGAVPA